MQEWVDLYRRFWNFPPHLLGFIVPNTVGFDSLGLIDLLMAHHNFLKEDETSTTTSKYQYCSWETKQFSLKPGPFYTFSLLISMRENIFLTSHKLPITFLLFSMLGMTFNRLTNEITDEIHQSDISLLCYNHHSLLKSKFQESFL